MAQRNHEQYKAVKGPKAKESGFQVGYEYTTGNAVNEKVGKKQK